MKKIPLKNYVVLGIILVLSVMTVLYINNWFLATKLQENKSHLDGFIKEIKVSDIDNYIIENPSFVIYLKSGNSDNNKFEKKLKKFLIENDLQKEFVYINLDYFDVKNYASFIEKYKKDDFSIEMDDAIIIIDNQKIIDVLYKEKEFDIKLIKKFLKDKGVY